MTNGEIYGNQGNKARASRQTRRVNEAKWMGELCEREVKSQSTCNEVSSGVEWKRRRILQMPCNVDFGIKYRKWREGI